MPGLAIDDHDTVQAPPVPVHVCRSAQIPRSHRHSRSGLSSSPLSRVRAGVARRVVWLGGW